MDTVLRLAALCLLGALLAVLLRRGGGELALLLALALTACGRQAEEDDGKVVYLPLWMEPYSVVYYDAHLNRTVESGGDLTEEEILSLIHISEPTRPY